MRILLTGSAGFIGFHVARALLDRGDQVIGYDSFNRYYDPGLKESRNAILEQYPDFRLIRADVGDRDALEAAFDDLVQGADTDAADRQAVMPDPQGADAGGSQVVAPDAERVEQAPPGAAHRRAAMSEEDRAAVAERQDPARTTLVRDSRDLAASVNQPEDAACLALREAGGGHDAGDGGETRVCHLAAQAGVRHSIAHPNAFVRDNVQAFGHVLELCREREVGGLIYASSSSVYGDSARERLSESDSTSAQCSLYGATKKMNELMASVYNHLYGLRATGLRFFTVYGPWGRPDMALFLFTGALLRGETIKVFGHGRMHRDFTYIDDIVAGVVSAIDRNHELLVCNLAAGRTEELMAFIRQIESSCGLEAEKEFLPMQPGDVVRTSADLSTAREALGYEPTTTIDVGIPRFVDWYREYYDL